MFKIKIEEKFNPQSYQSCMIGKWFVKYDSSTDSPVFTDNESEAGIFVPEFEPDNSLWCNLMALSDRFGYKGSPIAI